MIVHRARPCAVTNAGVLIEYTGGRAGRGPIFPGRVGRSSAAGPSPALLARLARENQQPTCDHCRLPVHRDGNGWWCDSDNTCECRANLTGHEVAGRPR